MTTFFSFLNIPRECDPLSLQVDGGTLTIVPTNRTLFRYINIQYFDFHLANFLMAGWLSVRGYGE